MTEIAVLIPCYNDAKTIGKVINDFQKYLPNAKIYVCDNGSTDKTAKKAEKYGAEVLSEPLRGKGNAVRRLFRYVNADYYFICDGDITYDVASAKKMLELMLIKKLDMVVASRSHKDDNKTKGRQNYPKGHIVGNKVFNNLIKYLFNCNFDDVFSGFRLFNKKFVKTFPNYSSGLEIESEICIHTASIQIPYGEVEARYFSRPEDSESKFRAFRNGFKILKNITMLLKEYKPFQFFSFFSIISAMLSFALGAPIILEYFKTGLIDELPTAFIAMGFGVISLIFFTCGIILDSIARAKRERLLLNYLSFK